MADLVFSAELRGNAQQLKGELAGATAEANKTTTAIREIGGAGTVADADVAELRAELGRLRGELGQVATAERTAVQRTEELGRELTETKSQIAGMSAELVTLRARLGGVGDNLPRVRAAFDFRGPMQQLSQVSQQAMATGDVMQALAIQAPDVGMAFGAWGIAAGVAAGLLLPLAANLWSVDEAADEAEDSALTLVDAIDAYAEASERARAPMAELIANYGSMAETSQEAARAQEALTRAASLERLQTDVREAADAFGVVVPLTERLLAALEVGSIGRDPAGQFEQLGEALGELEASLGISEEEALALYRALEDLRFTEGPKEAASAAQGVLDNLTGAIGPLDTLTGKAAEMANRMVAIVTAAADLNGELERGISIADSYQEYQASRRAGVFIENQETARNLREASSDGVLSLIRYVEGTGAGTRGYNETLENGAFTGGDVNLISMTLREVLTLQRQMLQHPDNEHNSSAVGAYQIVGTTLGGARLDGSGGLIQTLGLDLDQQFTPELQDRLAQELIRQRTPQGLEGFYNEWEGLKVRQVPWDLIQGALGQQVIPSVDPEVERGAARAEAEAQREHNQALAEAERIRASLRSETEAYNAEAERMNELVAAEAISREEADAHLAQYRERQAAANEELKAAEAVLRSIESPAEAYTRKVEELNKLFEAGALSQPAYTQAIAEAREEMARATVSGNADQRQFQVERLAAEQDRLNESISFGRDLFGGMIGDLRAGADGAEIFANALGKVADRLIDLSLDGLFGSGEAPGPLATLFSALSGGIGGGGGLSGLGPASGPSSYGIEIPGLLLSGARAKGGPVWPGGAFLVGEEGPEIYVPDGPGRILPNSVLNAHRSGGGGAASGGRIELILHAGEGVTIETVRNEAGAIVRQGFAAYDRALPGKVKAVRADPRRTGRVP